MAEISIWVPNSFLMYVSWANRCLVRAWKPCPRAFLMRLFIIVCTLGLFSIAISPIWSDMHVLNKAWHMKIAVYLLRSILQLTRCFLVGRTQDLCWWLCTFQTPPRFPSFHWNNSEVIIRERGKFKLVCELAIPACWCKAWKGSFAWSCTQRALLLLSQGWDTCCIVTSSV